jgi:hypothetical protein
MTSGAIMTGSPAQGIKTVPHPASGPAAAKAAKAVRPALPGVPPRHDSSAGPGGGPGGGAGLLRDR